MTPPDLPSAQAGDLGRRLARRRAALGKSIEETAAQAGIDPAYLRYVEQSAAANLSTGTTLLLALALECTPEELTGGRLDRPTGRGRAGRHPQLRELSAEQCRAHLQPGGVGRVVFRSERGPVAHPLNFVVDNGDVIVSTTTAHAEVIAGHAPVGFEVDRMDAVMSEGWSVLLTGTARRVEDPEEVAALRTLGLAPWAGGARHSLVRIHPDVLTGRVIANDLAPPGASR
jgi:nitroimidazol reductase NimA-like FMN-containing flavoprotein (pyridoxamine 5'-phosphate oxidase superfamily)